MPTIPQPTIADASSQSNLPPPPGLSGMVQKFAPQVDANGNPLPANGNNDPTGLTQAGITAPSFPTPPVQNMDPVTVQGQQPNFFQKLFSDIGDTTKGIADIPGQAANAFVPGNNLAQGAGNAGAAVATPVSNALNAVGGAIKTATQPILSNPFLQQILGGVNAAAATSPIGMSLNQVEQMANGVVGNQLPTVFGGNPSGQAGSTTANNDFGQHVEASDRVTQLQSQLQTLTAQTMGMYPTNPLYKTLIEAKTTLSKQLSDALTQQNDERGANGAVGTYAQGGPDMQDLTSKGNIYSQTSAAIQNIANAYKSGDINQLKQAYAFLAKNDSLMSEVKRLNPSVADDIQSSADNNFLPFIDKNGLIISPAVAGNVKGLMNVANIEQKEYDTKLRDSHIDPSLLDAAGKFYSNGAYNTSLFAGQNDPITGKPVSSDQQYIDSLTNPNSNATASLVASGEALNKASSAESAKYIVQGGASGLTSLKDAFLKAIGYDNTSPKPAPAIDPQDLMDFNTATTYLQSHPGSPGSLTRLAQLKAKYGKEL